MMLYDNLHYVYTCSPPTPCQGSTELTARALPEIAKLLQPQNGGDTALVSEAAKLLHDLTKKESSYKAVLSNAHVVRTMVQAMVSTQSLEVQKSLAGCIHNMSGDRLASNVPTNGCSYNIVDFRRRLRHLEILTPVYMFL